MPKGIYIRTEEHKRKMSKVKMGQKAWNKGLKMPQREGEKNPHWKGDRVGYGALHTWVERSLGKPQKCENPKCKYPRLGDKGKLLKAPKAYDWANISGKYRRDLSDWIRLCRSCHMIMDLSKS